MDSIYGSGLNQKYSRRGGQATKKSKPVRNIIYEDSSSSSSCSILSGENRETGRSKRNRRKVRSGAKVKNRPVVQTELWPHTISNEEDGDEVDSKTIGLAKFLSCFTYIMMGCSTV